MIRLKTTSQSSKILVSRQWTSEPLKVQRHIMELHTHVPQNRPSLWVRTAVTRGVSVGILILASIGDASTSPTSGDLASCVGIH